MGNLKSYVPRHKRLGVCFAFPRFQCYQDTPVEVPIIDGAGSVVRTDIVLKSVPVEDVMSKYNVDNFRLTALLDTGVPLKVVNINHSAAFDLSELQKICSDVSSAEELVRKFDAQRKEKESWFNLDSSSSDDAGTDDLNS